MLHKHKATAEGETRKEFQLSTPTAPNSEDPVSDADHRCDIPLHEKTNKTNTDQNLTLEPLYPATSCGYSLTRLYFRSRVAVPVYRGEARSGSQRHF